MIRSWLRTDWAPGLLRSARARLLARWYNYLGRRLAGSPIVYLNYGFSYLGQPPEPELPHVDREMRHYSQLYDFVGRNTELVGKHVLEIGCGYGGGAAYLHRTFGIGRLFGLDQAESAVRTGHDRFSAPGVDFTVGKAESLPVLDEAFDAVVCVEASHCFPDLDRFLNETWRVLRRGGTLVLADYRTSPAMRDLEGQLHASRLRLLDAQDISPNVLMSIEETHRQRSEWIRQYGNLWSRPLMSQFAGVRGSLVHRMFESGWLVYKCFCLERSH